MPSRSTQSAAAGSDVAAAQQAAQQLGLSFIRINTTTVSPAALALIDERLAREYRLIPVSLDPASRRLTVAVADPSLLRQAAPAFLQKLKADGYELQIEITPTTDFEAALSAYQSLESEVRSTEKGFSPAPTAQPPTTQPPNHPTVQTAPKPAQPSAQSGAAALPTPTSDVPASLAGGRPPISESVPASVHSSQVPAISLGSEPIPATVLARFPADVARKYQMVVYKVSPDARVASVGAVNPDDRRVREILKFVQERNGLRIELGKITQADLDRALAGYQRARGSSQTARSGQSEAKPPVGSGTSSSRYPATPTKRPDLKLASVDVARTVAKSARAPLPIEPMPTAAAPAATSTKIGGLTPAAPPRPDPSGATIQPPNPQPATKTLLPSQPVQPAPGDERNLDALLGRNITEPAQLAEIVKSGLVPKIVAAIVSLAVTISASDIHLEAGRDNVRIRYRIDGELQEILRIPSQLLAPLVSRLKILAKLKIDESRIPQDGRFDVWLGGHDIDLRMSTLPTIHGEKVVLRILDKSVGLKSLEDLGVSGTNLDRLRTVIADPFGIILVSGPTGSGKTSTLYALLSELNRDGVNIVTLEDPVEYQLEGINQTQVKPAIGFGFADGLRSILRQDPNIVMVGEIRDRETAALATQAALTGHLVLSTLHTNDAAGAIPRMIDMGVEPFLLASSLKAVVGQRLVRRLADEGKQPASVSPQLLAEIKQDLAHAQAPEVQQVASAALQFLAPSQGRASYHGRVGLYEVLSMSDAIADLALHKAASAKIAETALAEGMVTMRQDGILKALAGLTSLEEVLTVTADT